MLRLRDIDVDCIIGDLPEERNGTQRLTVDVELEFDLSEAARTDSLSDTVDYAAVTALVRDVLVRSKCRLIERAAHLVAKAVKDFDKRITGAVVRIRKSGSVPHLGTAEVEYEIK